MQEFYFPTVGRMFLDLDVIIAEYGALSVAIDETKGVVKVLKRGRASRELYWETVYTAPQPGPVAKNKTPWPTETPYSDRYGVERGASAQAPVYSPPQTYSTADLVVVDEWWEPEPAMQSGPQLRGETTMASSTPGYSLPGRISAGTVVDGYR